MDVKGAVVQESAPLPPEKEELEYTIDVGCAAATKTVTPVLEEQRDVVVVDGAVDLYTRVEALEVDRAATRREVASLRAEPARVVLAKEMARRLCQEAVATERPGAVTMVQKPLFSVLAIRKWIFSMILRRKRCSTARLTFSLSTALLGMLLLLERSTVALRRRRRLPQM